MADMTPHQERHLELLIVAVASRAADHAVQSTWGTLLNKEAIQKKQTEFEDAIIELKSYVKELMK